MNKRQDEIDALVKADSPKYRAMPKDIYKLAGIMRDRNNNALSTIYTQVEAVMGDSMQAESLKKLIKWEVWRLTDDNQDTMYKLFTGELDTPTIAFTPDSK